MSGLLRPKWLPMTELLVGLIVPPKNGSVETTTPPETGVGPEGTLPERWLAVSSMSLAPRSAMPIPEKFLSNCAPRHERVLSLTVLPFTSKSPTGCDGLDSKNMPAQLLWIVFPAMEPRLVSATYMPHGLPERSLPTTFAFAGCVPPKKIAIPTTSLRRATLERIFVPGESSTPMPSTELPMESFPAIVVFGLFVASIPKTLLLTTLFTILVRELNSTTMPWSFSSLPITWFFATVVLTLRAAPIALATLLVTRFPTTLVLRAWVTSITAASLYLKPRIVKPETLTSLTRGPVVSPVLTFTSPRTQKAPGTPKAF